MNWEINLAKMFYPSGVYISCLLKDESPWRCEAEGAFEGVRNTRLSKHIVRTTEEFRYLVVQ